MQNTTLITRQLGLQPYSATFDAMHTFTLARLAHTPDEVWFVEHPAVFTQGQAGKAEHILVNSDIPVVQSDRGGQVTYHAPGQQIMYLMVDLKRQQIGVREFVSIMENTIIRTLSDYGINAYAKPDAPGVYVNNEKICSLGLRVKKGCTFHGIALNVDMDLTPFTYINPCGYAGMKMIQLRDQIPALSLDFSHIRAQLAAHFMAQLHYNQVENYDETNQN